MKALLAIESSGKHGSIAIAKRTDGSASSEPAPAIVAVDLPTDRGSAQSLAESIDRLLRQERFSPIELGCIAVLNGPGSFTGLRVGIATAKAMAYALSIPVVELDTLDCIHYQIKSAVESFRASYLLLDAYRGQLFVKSIEAGTTVRPTYLCDIDQLIQGAMANGVSDHQAFIGPGCERLRRFLEKEEKNSSVKKWFSSVTWVNDTCSSPHATSVAALGWKKWIAGETIDPFSLLPMYFRASAAEEKAAKA